MFAIGAAIFTAAAALTQKKVLNKEHALEFSTVLAILNFAIVFVFLPQTNFDIGWDKYLLIYGVSWFAAIAYLMVAKAARHSEISAVSPIMNFGPAITASMAFLVLGEKISALQVAGIGLLILGMYVLEIKKDLKNFLDPFKEFVKSKYNHFIIFALILYGFTSIADRYIMTHGVGVETYQFIVHGFVLMNYLLIITIFYDGIKGVINGFKSAGKWILLVSIFTVAYRYMQAKAVSMMYVGLVSAIKRLSNVVITLVGGKIYHEKNVLIKVLGCIIMIWGAVFIII